MMASSGNCLRRNILRIVLAAGLVCSLQIASPQPLAAKPRPPIEMGDPDATGDQKPGTGPGATAGSAAKANTPGMAVFSLSSGWSLYAHLILRLVAFR